MALGVSLSTIIKSTNLELLQKLSILNLTVLSERSSPQMPFLRTNGMLDSSSIWKKGFLPLPTHLRQIQTTPEFGSLILSLWSGWKSNRI